MSTGRLGLARTSKSAKERHLLMSQALRAERRSRADAAEDNSEELNSPAVQMLTFVGCEDIFRGSSVNTLLRRYGKIFNNSSGSAEIYELSEVVTLLDCFISHNWCISRKLKFLALALHFNFRIGLIAVAPVVHVCAALAGQGLLPTVDTKAEKYPIGICCRPAACPAFVLAIFFSRDLLLVLGIRGRTAFFSTRPACTRRTPSSSARVSRSWAPSFATRKRWL